MIRLYFYNLVMLLCAWAVYAQCQQDYMLVMISTGILILSFLFRLGSSEKQYVIFDHIPLSVVIIASFFLGMFWRGFVPIPEEANSPFPEFTAALQSGSIFAAVFIWLRPFNSLNRFRLVFCSWLTVALAINVPFSGNMLMVFSAFCFVAISIVLLTSIHRPTNQKWMFVYARDYFVFSTLLIMLTTLLFLGISRSIVAMEHAIFNTMSDYIMPRNYTNFLRISPKLNLISPGLSAFDRRPILEVSYPNTGPAYLKLQVFDQYHNGTWLEPQNTIKTALPNTLTPDQPVGKLMMFVSFKDIVPLPGRITAIKAVEPYSRSSTHVIYDENEKKTRIAEFSISQDFSEKDAITLSDEEFQRHTAVPAEIAPQLKEIADSIVGDEVDQKQKTIKLVEYFQANFLYSLEVSFSADDQGLLKMLKEKKPAYCTYFASALALLLRAEGIPARVVAGFSTTEIVDRKNHTYLARVNNAHAWTELLLPVVDPAKQTTYMAWHRADATPADFSAQLKPRSNFSLELIFEKMWLGALRLNARIQNIDKDKVKIYSILFLVAVMAYINRKDIAKSVRGWLSGIHRPATVKYHSPDALRSIYERYERYLKDQYGEVRGRCETDQDVLLRIRNRSSENAESVNRIKEFVDEFQGARFGSKDPQNLEKILQKAQNSIK